MQSRLHSFIESLSNVAIGYTVALVSQILIFPLYDIRITLGENLTIGLWFTLISIGRSYVLRRWFNKWTGAVPAMIVANEHDAKRINDALTPVKFHMRQRAECVHGTPIQVICDRCVIKGDAASIKQPEDRE